MKFGLHYQLPCHDGQSAVQRYRDTIEQAAHAEALGFESVWPVEQHFDTDLSILSAPLLMLAAVAERTRTLRLGIAIILLPLSHPVRMAEEIATLDVISNGRAEFGIGRGSLPEHFSGFGISQSENRDRFLEGLDIILKAWSNERLSYHGQFFDIEDLSVVPKPVQQPHPPIRVAANSPEQVRQEMEPSIMRWLQSAAARYTSRLQAGMQAAPERYERIRSMTWERAGQVMGVFDTPEACVDRLHQLQEDFNTDRFITWFNQGGLVPHAQVMRSMELFAAKVMPHFA